MLPLLRRHRIRLENGIAVRIHGRLDFYAPSGRITLVMDQLDARFTLGQLAAQRDHLLRALVAEGLLDRNRRLPLPLVPLRVGVVTSRDAAAWHDFRAELHRSGLAFKLRVRDVRVQGDGADAGIAEAIGDLGEPGGGQPPVDVVVLVRGGGARTDLATFDSELVARAIAGSPVPVLTGLGHEIDRSVADEVAHTALKTPTACAGALIERVPDLPASGRADLGGRGRPGIRRRGAGRGEPGRHDEAHLAAHLGRGRAVGLAAGPPRRAAPRSSSRSSPAGSVASTTMAVGCWWVDAGEWPTPDRDLDSLAARVRALDPERTLARGWSITRRPDGTIVRSAADVSDGDELVTTLADGTVRSRVEPGGSPMSVEPAAVPTDLEALGYAEALAELEAILAELEGDAVDIDRLAGQVQRAAALIALCRRRIVAARAGIDAAVAEVEAAPGQPPS